MIEWQAITNSRPAIAVICGKENAAISIQRISAHKDIATADGNRINRSVGQAGTCQRPARPVVRGTEDTAIDASVHVGGSSEQIGAGNTERIDVGIRQTVVRRNPTGAAIGGKKDAATSGPGKQIQSIRKNIHHGTAPRAMGARPVGVGFRW